MAGRLGQTMRKGQPDVIQGVPGKTYWDTRRAFDREVKEALEDQNPSWATVTAGAVNATTASAVTINASGTASGGILITAEGDVRHASRRMAIHAAAFQRIAPALANGPTLTLPNWASGTVNADTVVASIPLAEGERMTGVEIYINRDAAASIVAKLWQAQSTGAAAVQLGTTQTSALVGGDATLTIACNEIAASGRSYFIECQIQATAGAGGLLLYGGNAIHVRP